MPFNRPNPPPPLSMDDKYLNQPLSPMSRPMDPFSVNKAPGVEPLNGNWSYDSAIDLFSLTPADMDPMSFDFADGLANTDTKDQFMDPFGSSNTINGFAMPAAEDSVSLSSDLDSDDQSWPNTIPNSLDMKLEQAPNTNVSTSPLRTSTSTTSSTRWSSSPEIQPQEYLTSKPPTTIKTTPPTYPTRAQPHRKPRSLSQDSYRSTTSTTTTSPPQPQPQNQNQNQDPISRNAAKRAAHNIIEKRYRTNMNAKFLALERAISPSSSGIHKPSSKGGAGSLKKSEILTNALVYIEGVQQENLALKKEVALLRGERGLAAGAGGGWRGSKGRC